MKPQKSIEGKEIRKPFLWCMKSSLVYLYLQAGTSTVVNFFLIRRDGTFLCFVLHLFRRNFRHGDSSKRYPWTWGMNIPILMLCEFLGV